MIQTFKTTLTEKKQLTHEVWLLTFTLVEPQAVEFIAGQYMITLVPTADGDARRLYSIASSPDKKNSFELLVHIIPGGVASEYFMKSNVGDEIMFQGPAGRFVLSQTEKNKVFLATGTGLAPMRSMFLAHLKASPQVQFHLLWGVPTAKDIYFIEELQELMKQHSNFTFKVCVSREQTLECLPEAYRQHFALGRITNDFQAELTNTEYYICGNRDMVDQVKTFLLDEHKVPKENVIFEKF